MFITFRDGYTRADYQRVGKQWSVNYVRHARWPSPIPFSPRRDVIDGAYDKTMVWLRDPDFPKRLLPPYIGLSDAELRACREIHERELKHLD